MRVVTRTALKSYFETGDTPTQAQFVNLIDSLANVSYSFVLASDTAAGATALAVDRPLSPIASVGLVMVDPFTVNCEVRKITIASASTFTVNQPFLRAHTAGVHVLFLTSDVLGLAYWGALDDGSDATAAVQAALDDQWCCGGLYWIGGQGKSFRIFKPLMLSSVARIQNIGIVADSTFSPADTNNAMVMGSQGLILTFTAATDDVITTPSAHGLPGTNVPVMFKNVTGATGIVAGRIYYARDVTATTFKVSATIGGAALDITSTGSGTVYCEVGSMSRIYLRDVFINGGAVPPANLNGLDIVTQQPTDVWKLRIDNCSGTALKISGQDGVFWNLMIINCGTGIALNVASYFKFYQWNIESCGTGVTSVGNCADNLFHGGHVEMGHTAGYSSTTSVVFNMTSFGGLVIDSTWVTLTHADQTFFKNNGAANATAYNLRSVHLGGSVDHTLINDADRNLNLKSWSHYFGYLEHFSAPPMTTSEDVYQDEPRWAIVGKNGRAVKFGSVVKHKPVLELQADTDQVGDILVVKGTSGSTVATISPAGSIEVSTVGQGFVLKSPDGTRYRIAVANGGALSATPA